MPLRNYTFLQLFWHNNSVYG